MNRKELSANGDEQGIPMPEPKGLKSIAGDSRASEQQGSKPGTQGLSRRTFLEVGSASLAGAALASLAVNAQEREDTEKADHDHSASNPGPEINPFWMKILIQISLRRPIRDTWSRYGTPSI